METLSINQTGLVNLFSKLDQEPIREAQFALARSYLSTLPEVGFVQFHEGNPNILVPLVIFDGRDVPDPFRHLPGLDSSAVIYPCNKPVHDLGFVVIQHPDPSAFLNNFGWMIFLILNKLRDLCPRNGFSPANDTFPLLPDQLGLPMYITNESDILLSCNTTLVQMLGYRSFPELAKSWKDVISSSARLQQISLLKDRGYTNSFELKIRHRNGRLLTVKDHCVYKNGTIHGVLFDVTEFLSSADTIKEELEIQHLLNNQLINGALALQKIQTTSIRALARLAEYRDQETGNHLYRICEYSALLAEEVYRRQPFNFHISESYVEDIRLSSMLHDIGKVAVPDSILRKRGGLNVEEWEIMRRHTIWGWQILSQADKELGEQSYLSMATHIALHHHERWDGGGYPHGLKGDKIPLSARIEALADVYDALTSRRPYKPAWSHGEAMVEIKRNRGTQFDPVLTDIFVELEDKILEIKNKYADNDS